MIGLTCVKSLAPDSLRIFLHNPMANFICNVGCCYHHLNEEFYRKYLNMTEEEVHKMASRPDWTAHLRRAKNGSLGPGLRALRIFLANPMAKFICNVGCCYHHLNEEFYRNPYMTEEEVEERQSNPSFPMSNYLRDQKFQLGKNALMVAAQPLDRLGANLPVRPTI